MIWGVKQYLENFPQFEWKTKKKKIFLIFLDTSSMLAVSAISTFLKWSIVILIRQCALKKEHSVRAESSFTVCVCVCMCGGIGVIGIDTYWMVSGMKHIDWSVLRVHFFSSVPLTYKRHDILWPAAVQWHASTVTLLSASKYAFELVNNVKGDNWFT